MGSDQRVMGGPVRVMAEKNAGHDASEWLTTHEAMAMLGVGRTRLWKLTKEGQLIAYRRGPDRRARFYARADVERLAREYHPIPIRPTRPEEA